MGFWKQVQGESCVEPGGKHGDAHNGVRRTICSLPCAFPQVLAVRIDDLDHLPETTTIDASSIGIVQVSTVQPAGWASLGGF